MDLQGFAHFIQGFLPAFGFLEHFLDLRKGGAGEFQGALELHAQHVLGDHIQWVRHGQPKDAIPFLHRHEMVLEHGVQGDRLEEREVHGFLGEIQGWIQRALRPHIRLGQITGQGLVALFGQLQDKDLFFMGEGVIGCGHEIWYAAFR